MVPCSSQPRNTHSQGRLATKSACYPETTHVKRETQKNRLQDLEGWAVFGELVGPLSLMY